MVFPPQPSDSLILDFQGADECLGLATSGSQSHAAGTSAYPPTGDIPSAMSAYRPISSALPPTSDVAGTPGECRMLTQSGRVGSSIPVAE
jgi:hypothetical protein